MASFAPVLPARLYEALDHGTCHLMQAHTLLDRPSVLEWASARGARPLRSPHTLILDNGLIELGHADVESLLKASQQVYPHEAVCPDAAFDSQATLDNFRSIGPELKKYCNDVMVVPQGKSLTEWMDCAETLLHYAAELQISITFGVSRLLNTFNLGAHVSASPRYFALCWLEEQLRQANCYHAVHLLGVDETLLKAYYEAAHPLVRSIDSTFPIAAALRLSLVDRETPKREMKPEDWELEPDRLSTLTRHLAHLNIAMCKRILG